MKQSLLDRLKGLMDKIEGELRSITTAMENIKRELSRHADGKILKGDELVGWLGEIYCKLMLNGTLVSDQYEYDFQSGDMRVSVKARKGWNSGWNTTSGISKLEGEGCLTHLMFIHFEDDFSIQEVWLYPWAELRDGNRFKEKKVKGEHCYYTFRVRPAEDENYRIYP